tara:strand:- start:244 stop:537 length:294 start_codon:yes stop_codon:yes gene_type:complete
MNSTFKDDLIKLEMLSKNISDLIFSNDYEKIIELDIERKKIIKKIIINEDTSISKNKVIQMINNNTQLIEKIDDKMNNLSSNHNKFSRRLQFYSLSN